MRKVGASWTFMATVCIRSGLPMTTSWMPSRLCESSSARNTHINFVRCENTHTHVCMCACKNTLIHMCKNVLWSAPRYHVCTHAHTLTLTHSLTHNHPRVHSRCMHAFICGCRNSSTHSLFAHVGTPTNRRLISLASCVSSHRGISRVCCSAPEARLRSALHSSSRACTRSVSRPCPCGNRFTVHRWMHVLLVGKPSFVVTTSARCFLDLSTCHRVMSSAVRSSVRTEAGATWRAPTISSTCWRPRAMLPPSLLNPFGKDNMCLYASICVYARTHDNALHSRVCVYTMRCTRAQQKPSTRVCVGKW